MGTSTRTKGNSYDLDYKSAPYVRIDGLIGPNGVAYMDRFTATPYSGRTIKTRSWGLTDNFHKLTSKERKNLPTQPFTYVKDVMVYPYGFIDSSTSSYPFRFIRRIEGNLGNAIIGVFPRDSEAVAAFDSALFKQADTSFLEKLKGVKVNIAQLFAERQQTIDMISATTRRVCDLYQAFKKREVDVILRLLQTPGDKTPARTQKEARRRMKKVISSHYDARKTIADGWLELQYGWKPLLSDVAGYAEALSEIRYGSDSKVITAKKGATYSESFDFQSGEFFVKGTYTRTTSYKYKIRVRASAAHSMSSLGAYNFGSIVWELTPWSFVVDWFFTVGSSINTMDAHVGMEFLNGSLVTVVDEEWSGIYYKSSNPDVQISAPFSRQQVTLGRMPLTGFPLPSAPALKNPCSKEHLLNALALFNQVFKRK